MAREFDIGALNFAEIVRSGDTVCWGQAVSEPLTLTRALLAQRAAIGGFNVFVGFGWSDTVDVAYCDHVQYISYCGIGSNRRLAAVGKLSILPCHYSQLAEVLRRQVDVLLLQLAPPGADGNYSLGLACEYLLPLIDSARIVVAEVNDQAPFTPCERLIRAEELDIIVRTSRPLAPVEVSVPEKAELAIAKHVVGLIEDKAVLQIGIGAIPECVVRALA